MKSFKQFLVENPKDSKRVNPFYSAINTAKEIGSAIADNPIEFAKEYGKSLFTDPETYHSGLAAAGTVPGVGEIADVADSALYAAQGDTESAKMALASAFPVAGILGNLARVGKSASKFAPEMLPPTSGTARVDLRPPEPKVRDTGKFEDLGNGNIVPVKEIIPEPYAKPGLHQMLGLDKGGDKIRGSWKQGTLALKDPTRRSPLDSAPLAYDEKEGIVPMSYFNIDPKTQAHPENFKKYIVAKANTMRTLNKDNPQYWENITKTLTF